MAMNFSVVCDMTAVLFDRVSGSSARRIPTRSTASCGELVIIMACIRTKFAC